jgi:hypothetical protein
MVFWDAKSCGLVYRFNVSELLAASIFRVEEEAANSLETLVHIYQGARFHIPACIYFCENLKHHNLSEYYFDRPVCKIVISGLLI